LQPLAGGFLFVCGDLQSLTPSGSRFVANHYLRVQGIHSVEQRVEWLYAFDIHCNSFFPLFVILYVLQYFCIPVLIGPGFLPTFITNTMYALAFGYYYFITFLGYNGKAC